MTARAKAADAIEQAIDVGFCAALAEPARLQILRVLLREGTQDVGEVASHLAQDRSVVSRHLQQLQRHGLVTSEKVGRQRCYTLDGASILRKLDGMAAALRGAMQCCCPEQLD